MLLDAAVPEYANTSDAGFWIFLIALIIVLIVSFLFCVKQIKKANDKKNKIEQWKAEENAEKENKDDEVQ